MSIMTPDPFDLARLAESLNRLPEAFDKIHERYAEDLAVGWKLTIFDVDAIDTWAYYLSVAARRASGGEDAEGTKMFVIDTDSNSSVMYSDIVERGRKDKNYAKGKPGTDEYGGRYPAGKSLEKQNDENLLETVVTTTLDEFLHG